MEAMRLSSYIKIDRGSGPRAGQLLRHRDDPRRWQVKVFLHRDERGRKRYRTEVVHGGRRDAEAKLLELLQAKSVGGLKPRARMTLRELVVEWVEHKARDVSERTLQQYVYTLDRYILPSLGHRKVGDLHLREIDQLYGRLIRGEVRAPGAQQSDAARPLGRTVRLAHAALRQALNYAVSHGLVSHNPAVGIKLPTGRPKEKAVLTTEQRARFIEACAGSFYGAFYRTLLDTGLRPGEACGLQWADVDFARGTISVQRTVTHGKDGSMILAEPKTVKSRRTVPVLGGLRDVLLAHLQWQRERTLDAAGYVFTNMAGEPLRPWTFGKADLRETLRRAGIPTTEKAISLYSLRHTFATLHVAAGTPLKVVSELLGHASIQQTANTYMHADPSITSTWMERFERTLAVAAEVRAPVN
jgi:integrase